MWKYSRIILFRKNTWINRCNVFLCFILYKSSHYGYYDKHNICKVDIFFVRDGSGTPATFKTEFFQTLVGQKTHVSTGTTFRNFWHCIKNSRIGYYGKNNVYKVHLLLQFFIFLLFLLWLHLCQTDQEPSQHLRWSSFRDQKEMFWKILDEPIICVIYLLLRIYIFIYLFVYILVFIAIDKNHKYL